MTTPSAEDLRDFFTKTGLTPPPNYFETRAQRSRRYADVKTYQQMRALVSSRDTDRLARLLKEKGYDAAGIETKAQRWDDYDIIKRLKRLPSGAAAGKKQRVMDVVLDRLPFSPPFDGSYLDVGAGSGSKTLAVAKGLGMGLEQVHAVDLPSWGPYGAAKPHRLQQVDYRTYDGTTLPLPDASMDLVSAFMVLHHVRDVGGMLREVERVLKPGGLFLIEEHDVMTDEDRMLAELEHTVYEVFEQPGGKLEFKPNYASFWDRYELHAVLHARGWKCMGYTFTPDLTHDVPIKPSRSYHALFRRPFT